MGSRKKYMPLAAVVLLGWLSLGGCHSTTVAVVSEDPKAPPELIVEIRDYAAGNVAVSKSSETDWVWGKKHNTTRIDVPPGTKIIVIPSHLRRAGWVAASTPASAPSTQPESGPAE